MASYDAGMSPPSKPPRQRRALATAAVLATLALLLGALLTTGQLPGSGPADAGPANPSSAPALGAAPPASLANGLGLPANGSPSAAVSGLPPASATPRGGALSAQQLAQIEAQWCSHGLQAHRQSEASVFQGEGGAVNAADPQAMDRMVTALRALPTTQAQEAVRQRMLAAWVERLERQGDPRSLATALYLRVEHAAGWSEAAEAAFQQQAATTTDPYVLHLWRQHDRACSLRGDCRTVPADRWSRIEPDNLLAWLPPGWGPVSLTDAQWAGVAQAKYVRAYHRDLQLVLLPLVRELPPGLELDVGLAFITQVDIPPVVAPERIFTACSPEAVRQGRRQACLHGADLLWRQPQVNLMDIAKALAMAKGLNAEAEGPWPGRMAEALALGNFNATEFHMLDMGAAPKVAACDALPTRRERLTEIAQQGSWRVAQRERAAAGGR